MQEATTWNLSDVIDWLCIHKSNANNDCSHLQLSSLVLIFYTNQIDGEVLLSLTDSDISQLQANVDYYESQIIEHNHKFTKTNNSYFFNGIYQLNHINIFGLRRKLSIALDKLRRNKAHSYLQPFCTSTKRINNEITTNSSNNINESEGKEICHSDDDSETADIVSEITKSRVESNNEEETTLECDTTATSSLASNTATETTTSGKIEPKSNGVTVANNNNSNRTKSAAVVKVIRDNISNLSKQVEQYKTLILGDSPFSSLFSYTSASKQFLPVWLMDGAFLTFLNEY